MRGILSSSITVVLLIIISVGVGFVFIQNLVSLRQGSNEEAELREELVAIQEENIQAQQELDFSKSERGLEIEARNRLGLRKIGEEVTIIHPSERTRREPLSDEEFLQKYNQQYVVEEHSEEQQEKSSFMDVVRSVFSVVLSGRDEEIL